MSKFFVDRSDTVFDAHFAARCASQVLDNLGRYNQPFKSLLSNGVFNSLQILLDTLLQWFGQFLRRYGWPGSGTGSISDRVKL